MLARLIEVEPSVCLQGAGGHVVVYNGDKCSIFRSPDVLMTQIWTPRIGVLSPCLGTFNLRNFTNAKKPVYYYY